MSMANVPDDSEEAIEEAVGLLVNKMQLVADNLAEILADQQALVDRFAGMVRSEKRG